MINGGTIRLQELFRRSTGYRGHSTAQNSTAQGTVNYRDKNGFGFHEGVFSHLHERYERVLLSFAEILLEHHFRYLAAQRWWTRERREGTVVSGIKHLAGNDSEAVGCTGKHKPTWCNRCYGRIVCRNKSNRIITRVALPLPVVKSPK